MQQTFTMKNTMNEVLRGAGPAISIFMPDALVAMIPEELRDQPMDSWAGDFLMPWGLPFPVEDFTEDANRLLHQEEYWDYVPLWTKEEPTVWTNDLNSVALLIPKSRLTGVRPAALICPGGGYGNISFHNEGFRTAARLEEGGYRTFILNYRFSPNRYPAPQTDLAMAIKHLRANASKYEIDPANLMILGYSAGGHLCASTAALRGPIEEVLHEELKKNRPELLAEYEKISMRPDKVCLGYPVISFLAEDHEPSFQCLTGGDESLREYLSIEKQVDPDYPKTFVWTCMDDSLVPPSNAIRMGEALEAQRIPHMLKTYPQGEHGCSVGTGTSAEGWMDEMLEFMK